jgi:glycosyltransferase involved in cell wall biosynthesis
VLHVVTRLNVGGPARHIAVLAAGARSRGAEVLVAAGEPDPGEGDLSGALASRGVAVTRVRGLRRPVDPLADAAALVRLARLCRRFRPDVVHTHTAKAGALGRLAARLSGVPSVVHTFHGTSFAGHFGPRVSRVLALAERALAPLADALVVLGETGRRDLERRRIGRAERVHVIAGAVEPFAAGEAGAFRRELGLPAGAPLVGFVGRIAPVKALPDFLDAVARAAGAVPGLQAVVVGDGPDLPEGRRRAGALGLEGRLRFLPFRSDVAPVYRDLDLLVIPSRSEGLPLGALEALSLGTPVIASAVGELPALLADGPCGATVPAGRADRLADAIADALRDPALRRAWGAAGTRLVARAFAPEALAAATWSLYETLLARAAGPAWASGR